MEEGHDLVGGWGTDYRGQGGSKKTSWEAITTVLVSEVVAWIGGAGTGMVVRRGGIGAMC